MTARSVLHTSSVIETQFNASPSRVFAAWTNPEAKRRWSDCHADQSDNTYSLDFRPGGCEIHRVVMPDQSVQLVQKQFFDILPSARIVFGYDIALDGRRLSVSLVTVQFEPSKAGTRMVVTEYIAYLDGHQDLEERIRGTNEGFHRLDFELQGATTTQ